MNVVTTGMLEALIAPLEDDGLKSSRKYVLSLSQNKWARKNTILSVAFIMVIFMTSMVKTADRLKNMSAAITHALLKGAMSAILGTMIE